MTERSLQVTYRKGFALSAYLHLPHRTGEKSASTSASPDGLLVVDYAATGEPIGIEITAPGRVPLLRLNQLLTQLGEPPLVEQDYEPVPVRFSRSDMGQHLKRTLGSLPGGFTAQFWLRQNRAVILYKYVPPERIDILLNGLICFSEAPGVRSDLATSHTPNWNVSRDAARCPGESCRADAPKINNARQ